MTIKCLDKGEVTLIDHMGNDERIVQSARVSYGKGTKTAREDKALIDYLMRNQHTSPFEQVHFTFRDKLPIFVARQIIRHRTTSINEISGRYSILDDEFYLPEISRIKTQSEHNKQGSGENILQNAKECLNQMTDTQSELYLEYQHYLDSGMAKELARINMPVSTYTEWYWSINLHNLFHFLKLRLDSHAQYEVRVYAQAKYDLIKPIVPWACESFERHILNGKRFSSDEFDLMKQLLDKTSLIELAERAGWKPSKIKEFIEKI